jgi:hypothetical protein
MGRKYIPVKVNGSSVKLYLDSLTKIYKCAKKTTLPIPPFLRKSVSRKDSLDTNPDYHAEVATEEETE